MPESEYLLSDLAKAFSANMQEVEAEAIRQQKCRAAHAGLYQAARDLLPLVQALADRERQLEAENVTLRAALRKLLNNIKRRR